MNARRVGVVMGGASSARAASLGSGRAIAQALLAAGHDVSPIVLGDGGDALEALVSAQIDVAFLALQDRPSAHGSIQGILEYLKIPYTGSSVLASALSSDKLKAKELFRLHNLPTPPYYVVDASVVPGELAEVHGSFGFPVVVKPRRECAGNGVSCANDLGELARAVECALGCDDEVLVERAVTGREIHVALLGDRVLGAIEVADRLGSTLSSEPAPGLAEYHLPARLGAARYRGVLNLAERAARSLDADGAVRVGLIVTEGQNEYVLEVCTQPTMTPVGLVPRIAEFAGLGFPELCADVLARARLHAGPARDRGGEVVPLRPALEIEAEPALVARGRYGAARAQRSRTR